MVRDGDHVAVGRPTVPGARVIAEVLEEVKGRKVIVFKYKSSVRYRRLTRSSATLLPGEDHFHCPGR